MTLQYAYPQKVSGQLSQTPTFQCIGTRMQRDFAQFSVQRAGKTWECPKTPNNTQKYPKSE